MEKVVRAARSRWRRLSRIARNTLIAVVVLLVLGRLALPYAIQAYVNYKLDKLPEYDGHIGDVDVYLFRGAYAIDDVKIEKQVGETPEPFFAASRVDFSLDWSELRRGVLVSEFEAQNARLSLIKGATEEESQTKVDKAWVETVEDLFPFRINRFELRNAALSFKDFQKTPVIDLFVTNMYFVATNVTNVRELKTKFPAGIQINGHTMGGGYLEADMHLNPFVTTPTFDVDLAVRDMNLPEVNEFLERYVGVDVRKGRLELFLEIIAEDGNFTGYIKPLIHDLDVVDLKQEKNVLDVAWEGIVSFFAHLFKNWPKDQFGTKIPISGSFDNPQIGIWDTIVNALRNALVKPLSPKVDETIEPDSSGVRPSATGREKSGNPRDPKTFEGRK